MLTPQADSRRTANPQNLVLRDKTPHPLGKGQILISRLKLLDTNVQCSTENNSNNNKNTQESTAHSTGKPNQTRNCV